MVDLLIIPFVSVMIYAADDQHKAIQSCVSLLLDEDNRTALVAGKVVSIEWNAKRNAGDATVKIEHVYSGPASLKGTTFIQRTMMGGFIGVPDAIADPLFKDGETGLWLMATDENTGKRVWRVRYRKQYTKHYDRKLEWAETVGKLMKLKIEERLKAAKQLCSHKTPEVAKLGIDILFGASEPDAKRAGVLEFIKGLPKNRQVTHSALARADRLLAWNKGDQWLDSPDRAVLLNRLTEELLTVPDAEAVADHLVRELDASYLMLKISGNPKQSRGVRRAVIERAISLDRGSRPEFAFNILVNAVKHDADDELRLLAAKAIGDLSRPPRPPTNLGSYTPAQVDLLRDLLKVERNPEVAKALKAAIDKPR